MITLSDRSESQASRTNGCAEPARQRSHTHTPDARCPGDDSRRILDAAVDILRQGELLLGAVVPETYIQPVPAAFNGSIGGHYRHCLDHFSSLLRGLGAELIDYDQRERDLRLEREPELALALTRQMRNALAAISPEQLSTPIWARCEVSYEHGHSPVTHSTLGRELVYAIAHGIHHYALIAVMARLMGVDVPPHFGVAPSTVNHTKTNPSPAR